MPMYPSHEWHKGDDHAHHSNPGPSRPHRTESKERQQLERSLEDDDGDDKRVWLPLIKTPGVTVKRARDVAPVRPKESASFEDERLEHSSVRAPTKVYVVEPYRIPPPLVAASVAARKAKANANRSNQANDRTNDKEHLGRQ